MPNNLFLEYVSYIQFSHGKLYGEARRNYLSGYFLFLMTESRDYFKKQS